MTPSEFFESTPFGSRIRYSPNHPIITVHFIARGQIQYAHASEEETGNRIFLILDKGRIKDAKYGYFDSVEIIE
ncbi:hypothetical protein C4585_02360 [Candidatus Parcubacteria bacterium]|nr:MAG: hypothetical protein C4585_02360 [Candidatus Parcubacteria bacterium]